MPVILRNNATSIELDFNANYKVSINKGDFDIVVSDPGGESDVAMVVIVPRSTAVTDNKFLLDWRDISEPLGITSAQDLRNLILSWNIPSVIIASMPPIQPAAGGATEAKQDTMIAQVESLSILRRILKLLQSNAVVDVAGRQRVVLDSLPGAVVGATLPISGTVTSSTTLTSAGTVTNLIANGGVDPRYEFKEMARLNYGASIRSRMKFT